MKNQSFLPSLQIFRAIAALMIVFHHLWLETSYFFHIHSVVLNDLAAAGRSGVDFFFVLSGFIICYAHFDKMGVRSATGEYLIHRILRIFLPYLPISLLMLASYRLFPAISHATRDISLVKSIFLLPVPGTTALSVAWTLVYEMFFYIVFVSFFLTKRFFYVILALWALFIGLVNICAWEGIGYFLNFVFSPYNIEFILGVCTAVMVKRAQFFTRKWIIAALIVAIVILCACPAILDNKILLGLLFSLLIFLAVNSSLNKISKGNLFMVLGNASYSIYLIHDPEISLAMRAVPYSGSVLYVAIIATLIFVAACFSGVIYSSIFEHRLLRKVKARFKGRDGRRAPAET
jgi:exopolysaccharide production protein ExoZ